MKNLFKNLNLPKLNSVWGGVFAILFCLQMPSFINISKLDAQVSIPCDGDSPIIKNFDCSTNTLNLSSPNYPTSSHSWEITWNNGQNNASLSGNPVLFSFTTCIVTTINITHTIVLSNGKKIVCTDTFTPNCAPTNCDFELIPNEVDCVKKRMCFKALYDLNFTHNWIAKSGAIIISQGTGNTFCVENIPDNGITVMHTITGNSCPSLDCSKFFKLTCQNCNYTEGSDYITSLNLLDDPDCKYRFSVPNPDLLNTIYYWTFGDGSSMTTNVGTVDHIFALNNYYDICVTRIYTNPTNGSQQILKICCQKKIECKCCNISNPALFTIEEKNSTFDPYCLSRQYEVKPCTDGKKAISHLWEFEDGTTSTLPTPPPHVFKNFKNDDGRVWIKHTVNCFGVIYVDIEYIEDFPNGVFVGETGGVTKLTDFAGAPYFNVYTLIIQNYKNPTLPLIVSGELVMNLDISLTDGAFYMVTLSQITIDGNTISPERRNFTAKGTKFISSFYSGISPYNSCTCWKGIVSKGSTNVTFDASGTGSSKRAEIRDALIGLRIEKIPGRHYCKLSVANTNFYANIHGIDDDGVQVVIPKFESNTFDGAYNEGTFIHHTLCGCESDTAISFKNVTVPVVFPAIAYNQQSKSNLITDFQKVGIAAVNTSVDASGFLITKSDHEISYGVNFENTNGVNSSLKMDNFNIDGPKRGVNFQALFGGTHKLTTDAAVRRQSMKILNVIEGIKVRSFLGTIINASIQKNKISTTGGFDETQNPMDGIAIIGELTGLNGGKFLAVDNELSTNGTNGYGINLNTALTSKTSTNNIRITHNNIDVQTQANGYGIYLNEVYKAFVFRNAIEAGNSVNGIEVQNGGLNTYQCNTVNNGENGLMNTNSTDNYLKGNTVDNNRDGIVFSNACLRTGVEYNNMKNYNNLGLHYINNAITGHNLHGRYNYWDIISINGVVKMGAKHDNNDGKSNYLAPSGSSPGTNYHPKNNGTLWFLPQGPIPTLPTSDLCVEALTEDPMLGGGMLVGDYENLVNSFSSSNPDPALEHSLKASVYNTLYENPSLVSGSTILTNFMNSMVGSSFATEYQQGVAIQTANSLTNSTSLQNQQISLENQSLSLFDLMQQTVPTTTNTLEQQISTAAAALEGSQNVLEADMSAAQGGLTQGLQSIRNSNATITTAAIYESNEKTMVDIYLKYQQYHGLNNADIATIRSLAQLCFKDGGIGVLKARALCISLLKEYYEDPQSCNSFQEIIERSANNKLLNFEMVALPNPTSDELVVQWSQPLTNDGILYLVDINGKVVLSNAINKGAMNQKIFLQHLSGGIYYIRLHSEGIQSTPLKVIVIH